MTIDSVRKLDYAMHMKWDDRWSGDHCSLKDKQSWYFLRWWLREWLCEGVCTVTVAMHRPTTTYMGWGWGIVGESTTKLSPGSGDLSFYILQLTAIQTLLSFLTKCSHFIVGPVGGNLYFSEVQIPTFPYLSPYYVVVGFTLIGALLVLHSQTTFSFCLGMAKKGLVQLRCFCAGFPLLLSECWLVTTSGAVNFLDVLIYIG